LLKNLGNFSKAESLAKNLLNQVTRLNENIEKLISLIELEENKKNTQKDLTK